MARKTGYELGRFSGFTYDTELFSPENTAQRILGFARSVWDGSEEKLDVLARAMEEGVGQALDTLGNIPGWLKAIIGTTEDLVRRGIEDMRAEVRGGGGRLGKARRNETARGVLRGRRNPAQAPG